MPITAQISCGASVLFEATDKVSHVSSLFASVGMDLVKDQKPENPHVLRREDLLILEPSEDVLQHDVVGEQNIWWSGLDLLSGELLAIIRLWSSHGGEVAGQCLFPRVLGVSCIEGDLKPGTCKTGGKLIVLGVGQGVHGVDDDSLDALHALIF